MGGRGGWTEGISGVIFHVCANLGVKPYLNGLVISS